MNAKVFDILQWMTPEAAAACVREMRGRTYQAGQLIYAQDEPGDEMYRIVSGTVRLTVKRADGRESVFGRVGQGFCFGVSSLVDDEGRPQSAEAISPVELQVLDRKAFARLAQAHLSFKDSLLRLLAQQMRTISSHLTYRNLSDISGQVAARILELTGISEGAAQTSLRVSQAEFAAMIGVSRQSINKALRDLQAKGLLTVKPSNIIVLDIPALTQIAEDF